MSATTRTDPFADLTASEIETELLTLAGHIAAAQCRFLQLLAEFDRRAGWAGPGLRSCAHWLCWRTGLSLRTATEHVRVAHALAELPRITAAFAEGRLSYSKVRAITRVIGGPDAIGDGPDHDDDAAPEDSAAAEPTAAEPAAGEPITAEPTGPAVRPTPSTGEPTAGSTPPTAPGREPPPPPPDTRLVGTPADREQTLLTLALGGTTSHVEAVVRATRRRVADPVRTAARRGLSWHWDEDGTLVLRGRFAPAEGAALIAAVEAQLPPRAPLTRPGVAREVDWRERGAEESPGAVADRVAARRADALVDLVTAERPDSSTGPDGTVARGRADVVVVVDAENGDASLSGGPEIGTSTAERLACDSDAQVLLRDRRENRLYLGRRRRVASPAQIAALTVRDGGRCCFPGCVRTRHLQAHHVRHWFHGGRTDLDNLVLLCGFHHRLIHDHGFVVESDGDRWRFRRPDGTPVPAHGPPLTGSAENLVEINTRADLRVTRESLTPTWAGERLDIEPILDRLLPRRAAGAAA